MCNQRRIVAIHLLFLITATPFAQAADRPITPTSRPIVSQNPAATNGNIFDGVDRGRRIIFLLDASGSMINKMAALKRQISKAVAGMDREQSFNVIFFQDNKCDMADTRLLTATPANKKKLDTFLENVTTTGTTDPIPGIEAAFQQKPDTIYLLTDGDFPDNDAVLKKIRDLNKDKHVRVNTIAFVTAGDNDTAFKELLTTLAKENRGQYKHVEADKLP